MKTTLDNTIEFDSSNNATIIGNLAHEFYYTKAIFNQLCEERPKRMILSRPNLLVSLGWNCLEAVKIGKNKYKISVFERKAA